METRPPVQDPEKQQCEGNPGKANDVETEEPAGPGRVAFDRSVAEGPAVIPQKVVQQRNFGGREFGDFERPTEPQVQQVKEPHIY